MAELNVSKKTVKQILDRQGWKYVVPRYQRPYSWDDDPTLALWNDILDFFQEIKTDQYSDRHYYLGCIVTIENAADRQIEIIDGQQRLTSLLLLLRAIYVRISGMTSTPAVDGQKRQIESCIWNLDPVTQQIADVNCVRLETLSTKPGGELPLSTILTTGNILTGDKSRYGRNYSLFMEKYQQFVQDEPQFWDRLVNVILNHCVVIPIECCNIDEALRIFNTLNNRGTPLSDADIFKSELYRIYSLSGNENAFMAQWNELDSIATDARMGISDLFRYYAYTMKSQEIASDHAANPSSTVDASSIGKEIDLRKFYLEGSVKKIGSPNLMSDVLDLGRFWQSINDDAENYDQKYLTPRAKRLLHCLTIYPNINWRRVVSVYFFALQKDANAIKAGFEGLLSRLLSYLCVRYINKPGVDAIRLGIAKACVEVMEQQTVSTVLSENIQPMAFTDKLKPEGFVAEKLTKTLIVLNAYLADPNGTSLIPANFNVEHILPRKWQAANYNGWSHTTAEKEGWLESLGNKIPFEKKLNIQAGNGFFAQKKTKYVLSGIKEVKDLANLNQDDWLKADVVRRLDEMTVRLCNFFMTNLA